MELATNQLNAPTARNVVAPGETKSFDLADLVALLLAEKAPSRDLDLLVNDMLGGKLPILVTNEARIRAAFWLRDQVPPYTAGNEALATLAHQRGLKVETYFDGKLWHVETRSLTTGDKVLVKHSVQGIAGITGIAALVSKETK